MLDRLESSVRRVDTIEEIDEALKHAIESKSKAIDSKKHIYTDFINDLLDERLGAMK